MQSLALIPEQTGPPKITTICLQQQYKDWEHIRNGVKERFFFQLIKNYQTLTVCTFKTTIYGTQKELL
jgi:hypothetical protein